MTSFGVYDNRFGRATAAPRPLKTEPARVWVEVRRELDRALADGGIPCQGAEPDAWIAEDPETRQIAAMYCWSCPALRECRRYAVAADERFGVWGGKDRTKGDENVQ